ncbi:MAG: ABC transporter substrate-binding protein [Oscillospiraceae bacterium]|nr:ABC transporter substrate-binding protein [Oscillospiraceae bacterium]
MKRNWLKSIALALTLAVAGGALAGCGGVAAQQTGAAETPSAQAAGAPTARAVGTDGQDSGAQTPAQARELTFWYAGGKTAVNVLSEIVDGFNASQDSWHITAVTQADYTETFQKLQAGIAGGSAPDIALLGVMHATYLAGKGLLEDLEPMMSSDAAFDRGDYMEAFFNAGALPDGTVFALPAYGTTQVLYYNIAAFERAGIDPESIKTWQDLEAAARAMTVRENGETVFYGWEPMWGYANMIDAALCNGARVFSDDGKTVLINSPEWVEVWETFGRWLHEDEIMTIHYGGQGWEYWYKTIDDVLQDKAGGYTGSSGDQADLDFSLVAAMEQPGWGENPSAPSADALQLTVPKRQDPDAARGAYEFMKYFTSPENQAKWSMATGYIAVRRSTSDVAEFKAYAAENPQALVPMSQAMHSTVLPLDPTGGAVYDALNIAGDKVEIEGISAREALDEAQKTAQAALDAALNG